MEKQYSVQFFTTFVDNLQEACRNYLNFNQSVEVCGYVSVEIDNVKKERYVLSELIQSTGNVVSESYCTKAFKTSKPQNTSNVPQTSRPWTIPNRNNQSNRENIHQQTSSRRRSWTESSESDLESGQLKVRRLSNNVLLGGDSPVYRQSSATSNQFGHPRIRGQLGQRSSLSFDASGPKSVQNSVTRASQHQGRLDPNASQHLTGSQEYKSQQTKYSTQGPRSSIPSVSQNQFLANLEQFNVPKPQKPHTVFSGSLTGVEVNIKKEKFSEELSPFDSDSSEVSEASSVNKSSSLTSPEGNTSQPAEGPPHPSKAQLECDRRIKQEPGTELNPSSGFDEDEIIDLDLFDDLEDTISDVPQSSSARDDQIVLSNEYSPAGSVGIRKEGSINPGTAKVVNYAVKQFKSYHLSKYGIDVDPFKLEPQQLDQLLLDFYQGVRKMNGEPLTARTLKNVQIHLDMYFRDKGFTYSIAKDDLFQSSRDFIKSKLENYVSAQKHAAVDDNDIEILFQNRILGCYNPDVLVNTMWFLNSKFFALRRPVEHHNLKWGDIWFKTDEFGQEYLERQISSTFSLKVFAKPENPVRCFVTLYKKYHSLRPQDSLDEMSPFYLSYHKGPNFPSPSHWFIHEGLSFSRFQQMWRRLLLLSGLPVNKKIC